MLSLIHVRGGNIGYFSDSIKMWRLIMQYNPSIPVSLYHKASYIIISKYDLNHMQTTMDDFQVKCII